jgi:hypothetical protein
VFYGYSVFLRSEYALVLFALEALGHSLFQHAGYVVLEFVKTGAKPLRVVF